MPKGVTKTGIFAAPEGVRGLACMAYRARMRACSADATIATYKADAEVTLLEGQKPAKQEDWDRRLAGISSHKALERIVRDHFDHYWGYHGGLGKRGMKDIELLIKAGAAIDPWFKHGTKVPHPDYNGQQNHPGLNKKAKSLKTGRQKQHKKSADAAKEGKRVPAPGSDTISETPGASHKAIDRLDAAKRAVKEGRPVPYAKEREKNPKKYKGERATIVVTRRGQFICYACWMDCMQRGGLVKYEHRWYVGSDHAERIANECHMCNEGGRTVSDDFRRLEAPETTATLWADAALLALGRSDDATSPRAAAIVARGLRAAKTATWDRRVNAAAALVEPDALTRRAAAGGSRRSAARAAATALRAAQSDASASDASLDSPRRASSFVDAVDALEASPDAFMAPEQPPTPRPSPQSRKRARGAASSPESSSEGDAEPRKRRAEVFDALAEVALPVLEKMAAMSDSDDRTGLVQTLLDAIQE